MSTSRLGSDLRSLEDSQTRALAQVNKQLTSDVTVISGTMDIKVSRVLPLLVPIIC
jgi:hypothetical protein